MYVFYPASRLVGLTIDYREIGQAYPFPIRNPSPDIKLNSLRDRSKSESADDKYLTVDTSVDDRDNKSDCFPRTSPFPYSEIKKSQSESPGPVVKRINKKRKFYKHFKENRKSLGSASLKENLKNLEIYLDTKPNRPVVKRTWSKHFKKAVALNIIKMSSSECTLRDMTHPALNETLKSHNSVTFKLVKTGE